MYCAGTIYPLEHVQQFTPDSWGYSGEGTCSHTQKGYPMGEFNDPYSKTEVWLKAGVGDVHSQKGKRKSQLQDEGGVPIGSASLKVVKACVCSPAG